MSALTYAFIMQLAAQPACSAIGMVPEFWQRVVKHESGYNPLALHDDTTSTAYFPGSVEASESLALQLMAKGHSVGIGLSQLTAKNPESFQKRFHITVQDALDACTNMHAGARWYVTGALSTYATGDPGKNLKYADAILADGWATAANQSQTAASKPALMANDPCPEHWDTWAHEACLKRTETSHP